MKRMKQIAIPALTIFFAASGVAGAQSLADLARRERERRSNTAETPVITNETIARTAKPGAGAGQTSKPPTESAVTPGKKDEKDEKDEKKDESKRGEAWWRKAFADAREEVRRADLQVQILDRELSETQTTLLIRNDIFNKEGQLIPRINALTADLEAARLRAAEARQKVLDLEGELRRSGGLPGWAR